METTIRKMTALDPDAAVREYLAEILRAQQFTRPDGGAMDAVKVLTEWPAISEKTVLPCIVLEPATISEPDYLGDYELIDDSQDLVATGYEALDFGHIEVPFTLTIITRDSDVRDLMLYQLRALLRSDLQTDSYEGYYGQPVLISMESFKRLETKEYAEVGIKAAEIKCTGETNWIDVRLTDKTKYKVDVEIED